MARLLSADNLTLSAVAETVTALKLGPTEAAAVKLAREYAAAIDNAGDEERATVLMQIGPKLLDALEALGATPRARARKEAPVAQGRGKLAAIREARRPA